MSSSNGIATEGLMIGAVYFLVWEYIRHIRRLDHWETAYWAERRGRARVEAEMKKLTEVQLNTSDGFFVQPIAHIHSCFRQCVGTPRQGLLVPSSRCTLKLTTNMSGESLDGLEEFSHVWLTFKFHLNTNTLKEARAFGGVVESSQKYTFTAKITPPMLKERKGILATRSPHRPNPFGVTLAKVESINKATRSVVLSACDLVDGTPVLDMKPYVPNYDSVEPQTCTIPTWILETINTRNTVTILPEVRLAIQQPKFANALKQYKNNPSLFIKALQETLEADVRSKFQTKRRQEDCRKGVPVEVPFDDALVKFLWKDDRVLEVISVEIVPQGKHGIDLGLGLDDRDEEEEEGEEEGEETEIDDVFYKNRGNYESK